MNLFALDTDPVIAARYNCNIHCNKIFLEAVQCLTNCFPLSVLPEMPKTKAGEIRSYSHYNHPICKWVRQNKANLNWTLIHTRKLEEERIFRGMKLHFTSHTFQWIVDNLDKMMYLPEGSLTPISPAISHDKICRQKIVNFDQKSFVEQYRWYYIFDKPFAEWTVREVPSWFKEMKSLVG